MYGCRVAEVAEAFRTLDTTQQVCDALAGERDLVAEQMASYLGALAGSRAQLAPQPPPLQQWRPPLPTQAWHLPVPQGPPSTAGPTSPRGRERGGHPPLLRNPPGARQRRVTLHRSLPRRRRRRPLPRPPPGGCPGGHATRCSRPGTGRNCRPPFLQPRPGGTVAREMAASRGATVRRSSYADYREQQGGQGSAARIPGPQHRTRGTAQGRDVGRSQGRPPKAPTRSMSDYMQEWAAPVGASGRPAGRPSAGPTAGVPARGENTGGWPTHGAPPASLVLPAAGDPWARPERAAPPAGGEQDL